MPFQNWSQVPSGLFHDFHQSWSIRIKDALNSGRLPAGLAALVEQRSGPREADVLAIEGHRQRSRPDEETAGGLATVARPVTRIVQRSSREIDSVRANRIVVKHHLGRIIAVIEIMSPGNKDSRAALRDFVEKTVDFVRAGVRSPGGHSIIALASTTKGGTISKIVSALAGPVTTARTEADIIVTEFGAAELRGQPLAERARRLVAIAHPDFREELDRAAHIIRERGF